MSDTHDPSPATPKPKSSSSKAATRSFDSVVEAVAKEMAIENPRGNHEVNLGVVHSLVQRTQGDLANATEHANESNAQKYLDGLCEKSNGLLFAAKVQAKLISDFCADHNLPVPKMVAEVDGIKSQ